MKKTLLYRLTHPESTWLRFLYLTVSGLLSGICITFPSIVGAIIEWIAFMPAALAIFAAIDKKINLARAWWGGFWLIYSQHLVAYHWFISFYPLEFTGISKLAAAGVVAVAWFGLSLLAAIGGGILGLFLVSVSRTEVVKTQKWLIPLLPAAGYVIVEWGRTKFWFGVPWSRLALGQLTGGAALTAQSASVFGSYFVTFLIVAVAFFLARAIYIGRFKLYPMLAAVLVISNLICGIVLLSLSDGSADTVCVAAIQGNISSRDKWDSESASSSLDIYCDLTIEAAEDGAELIVWPESAVAYEVSETSPTVRRIADICREYEACVVFGCFDSDDTGAPQNVLRCITADGALSTNVYVKRHLVPFGEYVPMREIVMTVFPPLGEIGMLDSDLVAGNDSELFEVEINGKKIKLGGLVCFDSIYEELAFDSSADGADMICLGTNDSWFEDSRAGYMHCAQARLRAIETGRAVIRAANTGISVVITSRGKVLDELEPLVSGYVISDISAESVKTSAPIFSELFVCLSIALFAAVPISALVRGVAKRIRGK